MRLATLALCLAACADQEPSSGDDASDDGRADDPHGDAADAASGPPAPGDLAVALEGSLQNPCWSPEGSRLVFTRFRSGYNEGLSDLALVAATGGAASLLTAAEAQNVNLPGSCWSAALDRIVYSSDGVDRDEIWTISPDGGTPARVTRRPGEVAWEPSLSPDAAWIVFESHPEATADESGGALWKVRPDGSDLTPLGDGAADDRQPNWSPAGDRIVFQSLERGGWDLFTIDPSGGSRTALTTTAGDDTDASFSPDGRRVVYSTDEGLAIVDLEGGEPAPLSTPGGYAGAPAWSPDGRWIAFETTDAEDPDGTAGTHLAIVPAP